MTQVSGKLYFFTLIIVLTSIIYFILTVELADILAVVLTIQQQLRYTLKMIRTSDIFKFNYNISFLLLFVPDTAATGNCNCGAHHLTTAEVLNFLRLSEFLYLQNFTKHSGKKEEA